MQDPPMPSPDAAPSRARTTFVAAATGPHTGLVSEFIAFVRLTNKWWLLPVLATILGLGLLIFLAGTAAAPFVYTLF